MRALVQVRGWPAGKEFCREEPGFPDGQRVDQILWSQIKRAWPEV